MNTVEFIMWLYDSYCVINSCKTTSSIFLSLDHGVLVLGVHTLVLVYMHLTIFFSPPGTYHLLLYLNLSRSLAAACTASTLHAVYIA